MADRLVKLEGDQVQRGAVDVILGQEPVSPPGPSSFHLWRNYTEVTPNSEWDATWREAIGGEVGTATITVQNREGVDALDFLTPSSSFAGRTRDIIKMTYGPGDINTDWCLWEGEVVTPELDLPVVFPWRRWKLGCSDWNTVPDLRLIGAPDGLTWQVNVGGDTDAASGTPNGPYPIDPEAQLSATDRITIQFWYRYKAAAPDSSLFDTDEFVGEYIDSELIWDPITGEPHFVPSAGPLRNAVSQLSALASFPIYDWIDPDRKVHHTAYDGPDGYTGLPRAPLQITDVGSEWDGTTKIGGRGLRIVPDFTFGPEEVYVNGVTPFVFLASADPEVDFYGGRAIFQGTGWGHSTPVLGAHHTNKRQMSVEGKTVTRFDRDSLADTYTAYGSRPRYRGTITIGGRQGEILTGWRAGQLLTITDARLPDDINGIEWPIQALNGSLIAGDAASLVFGIEFGDAPIGRFSAQSRFNPHTTTVSQALPYQPAPRHVIYFETLNPLPESTQTLTSQAMDNADQPLRAAGLRVTWEFVSVTDSNGNDKSGNGESLSPSDTVTNQDGKAITTFTAGTLTDVYYQIEASTPVQV